MYTPEKNIFCLCSENPCVQYDGTEPGDQLDKFSKQTGIECNRMTTLS